MPTRDETEDLVDRHLLTPYAYPTLRENLRAAAVRALDHYFDAHGDDLTRTEHSEKQIEVVVSPGVTVNGRIDLIKRLETDEVAIIDFKSTEDAQDSDMTRDQLGVYALGYRVLTGASADRIQVLNLDERGDPFNVPIHDELLANIRTKIEAVAEGIRAERFPCGHDHSADTAFNDLAWLTEGAPPSS